MRDLKQFYINGEWVSPHGTKTLAVVNPATEEPAAEIALGDAEDIDRAVKAARAAFPAYAATSREARLDLFDRIIAAYQARYADIAAAITEEMGAPATLSQKAQAATAIGHFSAMKETLKTYPFTEEKDGFELWREPIGVAGLITPWNWPVNQIVAKVAPAFAAGCTVVLKPSEVAPISAHVFAEVLHEAGVPKGVFNLVHGDGPGAGAALSAHPQVDMISFTGSTRAGVEIAKAAAPTVKRVAQELGGKSPNIILDDADFEKAVKAGMRAVVQNTGQSCNAPTRMLVPAAQMEEAMKIAAAVAGAVKIGDPADEATQMGPLASEAQWKKVQALIEKGVAEGAKLAAGGPGRPDGVERGFFPRPTVFGHVTNDMTIAREEIFGPVLSIIAYKDEAEAVAIANDTPYGLSSYVQSGDAERARRVAAQIRAGNVHINGAQLNFNAPFGGYKQSGNGREWGEQGLEEFLETKSVLAA